jgi:hypothetical protein
MESLQGMIRQLEAWWGYTLRCVQSPGCDSARIWVTIAAVVVALTGLVILRKMVRKYLAYSAERLRVAEKARVADVETLSRYRVDSDKFYAGQEQADIEQRIRQALAERKAKDQGQPGPGASGRSDGTE